eukprot:352854-Chlamydomonas_euryale.AAC.8
MKRYPTSPKDDAKLLKHPPADGAVGVRADRLRLAVLVRCVAKEVKDFGVASRPAYCCCVVKLVERPPTGGNVGARAGGPQHGNDQSSGCWKTGPRCDAHVGRFRLGHPPIQTNSVHTSTRPHVHAFLPPPLLDAGRLGEKDVLQLLKKSAVMLMMGVLPGQGKEEEGGGEAARGRKRGRGGGGGAPATKASKADTPVGGDKDEDEDCDKDGDEDEDDEDVDEDGGEGGADEDERERELLASDDSDKVGYGEVDFDDGAGEAHDRLKPHAAPKD